jgi:pimeloyl-ACP methyl ester carboxylesterase
MPLPDQGTQIADLLAVHDGLKGRFIVLVGHSMGGLVIKTLITQTQAYGDARSRALVRRMCGVAFVATPRQGSQLATLAKAITAILRTNAQVGDMRISPYHLVQPSSEDDPHAHLPSQQTERAVLLPHEG